MGTLGALPDTTGRSPAFALDNVESSISVVKQLLHWGLNNSSDPSRWSTGSISPVTIPKISSRKIQGAFTNTLEMGMNMFTVRGVYSLSCNSC